MSIVMTHNITGHKSYAKNLLCVRSVALQLGNRSMSDTYRLVKSGDSLDGRDFINQ